MFSKNGKVELFPVIWLNLLKNQKETVIDTSTS